MLPMCVGLQDREHHKRSRTAAERLVGTTDEQRVGDDTGVPVSGRATAVCPGSEVRTASQRTPTVKNMFPRHHQWEPSCEVLGLGFQDGKYLGRR